MAAGRPNAVVVVAVVALLLAAVVRAGGCFDYCFKNCVAKDKSMADYCNYACDKTCDPDATPAAAGDMACQLSCAKITCGRLRPYGKATEACFGRCYDGCSTNTLPRPLHAGAGVLTASGLHLQKHPFHEKQAAVQPASEPDPDGGTSEKHPFHEKRDGVQPASEPEKNDSLRPAWGSVLHAAAPAPA